MLKEEIIKTLKELIAGGKIIVVGNNLNPSPILSVPPDPAIVQ
jgi:hypothetical protein